MRIICIDDEPLAVEHTVELCRALEGVEAAGFASAREALGYLRTHPADAAILDVNMPEMDGIALAARIREVSPDTAVIFLTAHREYALEAYAVHPSGYLLKPATLEKLAAEIAYACRKKAVTGPGRVKVKTFGNFDVYVDDRPVSFKLGKAKELLAYLVDKQGAGVTRGEIFAAIWEDRLYDRKMQKQLDVYVRSLRDTLREYGVPEIMEMEKGVLRVRPETFTCDAYLFYSGDSDMINVYRGEYMSAYSWASMTEAILSWKTNNI